MEGWQNIILKGQTFAWYIYNELENAFEVMFVISTWTTIVYFCMSLI